MAQVRRNNEKHSLEPVCRLIVFQIFRYSQGIIHAGENRSTTVAEMEMIRNCVQVAALYTEPYRIRA